MRLRGAAARTSVFFNVFALSVFVRFSGFVFLGGSQEVHFALFFLSQAGVALHSLPGALQETSGARLVSPLPLPHVREQLGVGSSCSSAADSARNEIFDHVPHGIDGSRVHLHGASRATFFLEGKNALGMVASIMPQAKLLTQRPVRFSAICDESCGKAPTGTSLQAI